METNGLVFCTLCNTTSQKIVKKGKRACIVFYRGPGSLVIAFTCDLSFTHSNPLRLALFPSFYKHTDTFDAIDCLLRASVDGGLEQLERIFKEVRNRLLRSLLSSIALPKTDWWKSKLCQGTLNPFSGKESMHWLGIPSVPSGWSGQWGVTVLEFLAQLPSREWTSSWSALMNSLG